ncbi:MAG: cytidylate kinase-like family protein, partial [Proteobacteria bacterium]|nr:cytidylate kinase-like family protein [Pseudomonadota bacterium]
MSIITISRDIYSHGREIAEHVAEELGFECLGAEIIEDVVSKASQGASDDLGEERRIKKEIVHFRRAFYDHMAKGNIVYHGLAGHVFLADIPDVLNVRLVADLEDRMSQEVRRTGHSFEEALDLITREDRARKQWHRQLFGPDEMGSDPYDLSLNLHNLGAERAAKIIVDASTVAMACQNPMKQAMLADLSLAAQVELLLLDHFHEVQAEVRAGTAYVRVAASIVEEAAVTATTRRKLAGLPGLRAAHVGVLPASFI